MPKLVALTDFLSRERWLTSEAVSSIQRSEKTHAFMPILDFLSRKRRLTSEAVRGYCERGNARFYAKKSVFRVSYCSGIGYNITDVRYTRKVHYDALEAESKACVLGAAVFTQV